MRIACLQFAPQLGDVDNNLNRADAVLSKANPEDLDLLVLPELAFSGYNFKSLNHITPFLEPTTSGITSLWARTTALKYDCVVTVGYPEKVDVSMKWPTSPEYYNSAIVVGANGETIANYRKSFLYYTDETWALEGPDGFYDGEVGDLGNVALGICMDLNPYKFEAPWCEWEFAYHILRREANLVILSMAWLTREDARAYSRTPKEPDMETLSYWLARLEPLIRAETEGEIIVVFANRCGIEDDAVYAGSSAVLGINCGEVKVYGILGRGEKELLVVDTTKTPQAKLVAQQAGRTTNTAKCSAATGPRTNSSISDRSGNSTSTNFSVDTAATSPQTPDAMDFMEEIPTPISPVEPTSPTQFFAPRRSYQDLPIRGESLKSSITHPHQFETSMPDSATFYRPSSPKSRNASRNRKIRDSPSPPFVRPDSRCASRPGYPEQRTSYQRPPSRTASRPGYPESSHSNYGRPPSPKSRSASRNRQAEYEEPALLSHSPIKAPQLSSKPCRVDTPATYGVSPALHSASAVLGKSQQILASSRARHIPPRPKSAIW